MHNNNSTTVMAKKSLSDILFANLDDEEELFPSSPTASSLAASTSSNHVSRRRKSEIVASQSVHINEDSPLSKLYEEIFIWIFEFLGDECLGECAKVCASWRKLIVQGFPGAQLYFDRRCLFCRRVYKEVNNTRNSCEFRFHSGLPKRPLHVCTDARPCRAWSDCTPAHKCKRSGVVWSCCGQPYHCYSNTSTTGVSAFDFSMQSSSSSAFFYLDCFDIKTGCREARRRHFDSAETMTESAALTLKYEYAKRSFPVLNAPYRIKRVCSCRSNR